MLNKETHTKLKNYTLLITALLLLVTAYVAFAKTPDSSASVMASEWVERDQAVCKDKSKGTWQLSDTQVVVCGSWKTHKPMPQVIAEGIGENLLDDFETIGGLFDAIGDPNDPYTPGDAIDDIGGIIGDIGDAIGLFSFSADSNQAAVQNTAADKKAAKANEDITPLSTSSSDYKPQRGAQVTNLSCPRNYHYAAALQYYGTGEEQMSAFSPRSFYGNRDQAGFATSEVIDKNWYTTQGSRSWLICDSGAPADVQASQDGNATSNSVTLIGTYLPRTKTATVEEGWQDSSLGGHILDMNNWSNGSFAYREVSHDQEWQHTKVHFVNRYGLDGKQVTAQLDSLKPDTWYEYTFEANNAYGSTKTTKTSWFKTAPSMGSTTPATDIGGDSATLNGEVDTKNFGQHFAYRFEYGPKNENGQFPFATELKDAKSGKQAVTERINGLANNKDYHWRLAVYNRVPAQEEGMDDYKLMTATDAQNFTTQAPVVVTGQPKRVSTTNATLTGEIDPRTDRNDLKAAFELTNVNDRSDSRVVFAGFNKETHAVNATVDNLHPGTEYEVRLTAKGEDKKLYSGRREVLNTQAGLAVTAYQATEVSTSSAKVRGSVDGLKQAGKSYFEYRPDNSDEVKSTDQAEVKAGGVLSTEITNLTDNTDYVARPVVVTADGVKHKGQWQEFHTLTTPKVSTKQANNTNLNKLHLTGEVDPKGTAGTYHFEWSPENDSEFRFRSDNYQFDPSAKEVSAEAMAQNLQPGKYKYRLVVNYTGGESKGKTETAKALSDQDAGVTPWQSPGSMKSGGQAGENLCENKSKGATIEDKDSGVTYICSSEEKMRVVADPQLLLSAIGIANPIGAAIELGMILAAMGTGETNLLMPITAQMPMECPSNKPYVSGYGYYSPKQAILGNAYVGNLMSIPALGSEAGKYVDMAKNYIADNTLGQLPGGSIAMDILGLRNVHQKAFNDAIRSMRQEVDPFLLEQGKKGKGGSMTLNAIPHWTNQTDAVDKPQPVQGWVGCSGGEPLNVTTGQASDIGSNAAELDGFYQPMVHPDNTDEKDPLLLPSETWFEFGTDPKNLDQSTDKKKTNGERYKKEEVASHCELDGVGCGKLEDLKPDTTYYYRTVSENDNGETRGKIESFHTRKQISVETLAPSAITSSGAKVEADVKIGDAEGVKAVFQADNGDGHELSSDVVDVKQDGKISAKISGLIPEEKYNVRAVIYQDERGLLVNQIVGEWKEFQSSDFASAALTGVERSTTRLATESEVDLQGDKGEYILLYNPVDDPDAEVWTSPRPIDPNNPKIDIGLENLDSDTTYEVTPVVFTSDNEQVTLDTEEVDTLKAPTVASPEAEVSENGAVVSAKINTFGERGMVSHFEVTDASGALVWKSEDQSVRTTNDYTVKNFVPNLKSDQTYNYRAVVTPPAGGKAISSHSASFRTPAPENNAPVLSPPASRPAYPDYDNQFEDEQSPSAGKKNRNSRSNQKQSGQPSGGTNNPSANGMGNSNSVGSPVLPTSSGGALPAMFPGGALPSAIPSMLDGLSQLSSIPPMPAGGGSLPSDLLGSTPSPEETAALANPLAELAKKLGQSAANPHHVIVSKAVEQTRNIFSTPVVNTTPTAEGQPTGAPVAPTADPSSAGQPTGSPLGSQPTAEPVVPPTADPTSSAGGPVAAPLPPN